MISKLFYATIEWVSWTARMIKGEKIHGGSEKIRLFLFHLWLYLSIHRQRSTFFR
jgi:hypothetical protein